MHQYILAVIMAFIADMVLEINSNKYIHTRLDVCINTHIDTYMYKFIQTCINTYMYTHIYRQTGRHPYIYTCTLYTFIHIHICIQCTCIHTYIIHT